LKSTPCETIARELLRQCVAGSPPAELPRQLLDDPCANALFGIFIEGLADRFEPALCDAYVRLFSHAIEGQDPAMLVARYQRARRAHPVSIQPRRVVVLSRITLGADIAITSVILSAARPRKNFELFATDPRLTHAAIEYQRGTIRDRLSVWEPLQALAAAPDCLVLDPDSRLTQLGLLPICPEERYHLFESRRYGGATEQTLTNLAAQWSRETMGVSNATPYLAPADLEKGVVPKKPYIAVSLGVGENAAKRISDSFERQLLALLSARLPLVIDKGAGGEEAARVERAAARAGASATFWSGSFAGFAQFIAHSRLYVGYDSAGQHVATACGIPLIAIFSGFASPRMFQRWRPSGPQATVFRVDQTDPVEILAKVAQAIK